MIEQLSDEAIEVIWEKTEKQRFEHPDANKPDFQFFDPIEYGKAVAQEAHQNALRQVVKW
ncbi:hypothetical protein LCGC14_3002010, partial [marine sediment metagenome]